MYTMMQVCRETDMTYQTLKYYCNEGLTPMSNGIKITAVSLMNTTSNGSRIWCA